MNTPITEHHAELVGLPRPGEIFDGKYRIDGVLGVGGMAAVLAATHLGLDERVALKVLLPESTENPGLVQRFMGEGRASSKIHSEHVVRVMDVGIADGRPYLVLEYLVGQDLGAVLNDLGPLAVTTAVDFVLQACEAMAEAHARGVIHRDLKPTNLFLTHRADGTSCVKVLDFGISKIQRVDSRVSRLTPRTLANEVMGSPHYMPPEQLEAATNVDERSDIWSLGAILYELLSGHPPFEAETMTALYACILRDPPAPLAIASPALEAVVLRCLEKDPDRRFRNTAELARALVPFGSAEAQASAESIARVVEGGLQTEDAVAVSHRLATSPTPRRLAQISTTLSPTRIPMRAPIVGYLFGAAMLVAAGGVGGWTLVHALGASARPGALVTAGATAAQPPAARLEQSGPMTGSATTTGALTNAAANAVTPAPAPAAEERPHRAHASHAPAPRMVTAASPSSPAALSAPPPAPGADSLFDERK